MKHLELRISVSDNLTDLLIAELSEIGFDSFLEAESLLLAYIPEGLFNENKLTLVLTKYRDDADINWTVAELEEKNWNEEWEKSFEPVVIKDKFLIRASFHNSDSKYPLEIIIDPKMSFGTGHHETTVLMAANQLKIEHQAKKVMDAGSGTGILAILAEKLGASEILAYDIEEWAFRNMTENIALNNCQHIVVAQGTISELQPPSDFDIILANINRNVLLEEMSEYYECLKSDGILLLSGFYRTDIPSIEQKTDALGLVKISEDEQNNWVCLKFQKHKRN